MNVFPPWIIGDVGSTHMGKLSYAKDLIRIGKDIGLGAVKFQLFKGEPYVSNGNIPLPYDWWPELVDTAKHHRIEILASVFDEAAMDLMRITDVKWVKLAASKAQDKGLAEGIKKLKKRLIISANVMNMTEVRKRTFPDDKILFCISEYPVKYIISFDGIFPAFDGFSDHTLGIKQTLKAIEEGAQIIEKHWRGPHPNYYVPDSQFALNYKEMEELCRKAG